MPWRARRHDDLRDCRLAERTRPPIAPELMFRHRFDLDHVVFVAAEDVDGFGGLAAIESDMTEVGPRTASPKHRDCSQRGSGELLEVRIVAERLRQRRSGAGQ